MEATIIELCPTDSMGSYLHSWEVFISIGEIAPDDEREEDISSDHASIVGATNAKKLVGSARTGSTHNGMFMINFAVRWPNDN